MKHKARNLGNELGVSVGAVEKKIAQTSSRKYILQSISARRTFSIPNVCPTGYRRRGQSNVISKNGGVDNEVVCLRFFTAHSFFIKSRQLLKFDINAYIDSSCIFIKDPNINSRRAAWPNGHALYYLTG